MTAEVGLGREIFATLLSSYQAAVRSQSRWVGSDLLLGELAGGFRSGSGSSYPPMS